MFLLMPLRLSQRQKEKNTRKLNIFIIIRDRKSLYGICGNV